MKDNLKSLTFLLLVRIDTIQRLENTMIVVELLCRYFDTNVMVREAGLYNNNILASLLKKKVKYEFVEDLDPILHKTRHFNEMSLHVNTPYMAIWDVDIVPEKRVIIDCVQKLEKNEADVAYPYNGNCYNVSKLLRELFIKKKDIHLLHRHKNKINLLHNQPLVGGAVLVKKDRFIFSGKENEKIYGWGDDDFCRYYHYLALGFKIYRARICLFHLWHPRQENSCYENNISRDLSKRELFISQNKV